MGPRLAGRCNATLVYVSIRSPVNGTATKKMYKFAILEVSIRSPPKGTATLNRRGLASAKGHDAYCNAFAR
jgi:hypothetical protein